MVTVPPGRKIGRNNYSFVLSFLSCSFGFFVLFPVDLQLRSPSLLVSHFGAPPATTDQEGKGVSSASASAAVLAFAFALEWRRRRRLRDGGSGRGGEGGGDANGGREGSGGGGAALAEGGGEGEGGEGAEAGGTGDRHNISEESINITCGTNKKEHDRTCGARGRSTSKRTFWATKIRAVVNPEVPIGTPRSALLVPSWPLGPSLGLPGAGDQQQKRVFSTSPRWTREASSVSRLPPARFSVPADIKGLCAHTSTLP